MKDNLLRKLLLLDGTVLVVLGALLIVAPKQTEAVFHFGDLPRAVSYIIGLWGCVLATMGLGYGLAAADPRRHIAWVQVGIARGFLECVLGVVYLARGIVTFQQAGFGIAIAAFIALAYIVLYPGRAELQPRTQ